MRPRQRTSEVAMSDIADNHSEFVPFVLNSQIADLRMLRGEDDQSFVFTTNAHGHRWERSS